MVKSFKQYNAAQKQKGEKYPLLSSFIKGGTGRNPRLSTYPSFGASHHKAFEAGERALRDHHQFTKQKAHEMGSSFFWHVSDSAYGDGDIHGQAHGKPLNDARKHLGIHPHVAKAFAAYHNTSQ